MNLIYQLENKERLDKYLQKESGLTRNQIKKMILAGHAQVNNELPSVHHWLKKGDKVAFTIPKQKTAKPEFEHQPKIIDQNDEFLVLEKPSGLLVHPTDKGENNTLADWLVNKFPSLKKIGDDPRRPAIVHRLDKEVSGLMVIPLSQASFDSLKKQFQQRTIKKEYTALVHGQLINEQGQIEQALERDKKSGLMKAQSGKEAGKVALTTYQVIKKFINYTLVKVQIKTGRLHQIRAHFYSIGHSIVGDKLYQTKDLRKKKKVLNQRIFLHAGYLEFTDLTGQSHQYQSPLPTELKKFLTNLK
ncbi:MAG: RluA family pseudouridine synthase [Patescibacteria group bacterium]|nr:RluA family pseudouridine synthase [Patescibacteria group bacterium]